MLEGMLGMGAGSRVKRDDRGITNYDIRSVRGLLTAEIYLFSREALIQMLKAMRAQDKKEAQAAQAQDRVRPEYIKKFPISLSHIHSFCVCTLKPPSWAE